MRQLREVNGRGGFARRQSHWADGSLPARRDTPDHAILQALLVDVDGTMIATNDLHTAAWCDAFRAHGYALHPEVIAPMIGMGSDKIVSLCARGLSTDEGLGRAIAEDHKRRFLDGYIRQARPTPGARDLLLALRRAGVKVYVASSAQGDERETVLQRAGIADLVEPPPPSKLRSKPDRDVVVAALRQADVDPDCACMLGDTPYDIAAATDAGVAAVAVRCGGWDDRALAGAAAIYDDPADVLRHLDDWALPSAAIASPR